MDSIIANLTDPSWWFTGFFFLVVPWLLPYAFRALKPVLVGFFRRKKRNNLRSVKALRWSSLRITHQISRANANYILFVIMLVVFVCSILFTPLRSIARSVPLTLLFAFPIYFFEIRWLNSDSLAKEAIKSREKIAKLRDGTVSPPRRS
jgi:hypothetical protein